MRRLSITLALLLALYVPARAQSFGSPQTITVVDSGTACVTAPAACAIFPLDSNSPGVTLGITGTWTGTLTFEGTNDGSTWIALGLTTNLATGAQASTTTASGLFAITNAGVISVRARATAAVTGTAIVRAARGSGFARGGVIFGPGGTVTAPVGTGGAIAGVGGSIFTGWTTTTCGTAQLSNLTTVETDLCLYAMPGATLATNGNKVRVSVYGTAASNANVKTVKLYFGATVITTLGTSINGVGWMATAVVTRTGAATQVAGSIGLGANGAAVASQATAPTETLSGAVTIKVTGQSGTAGADLTLTSMVVEWIA